MGYTNAGKSTLLNTLCKADILADDRLFATLDPTTRRLTLPDKRTILLSDTVGFIRKLPPTIIDAFRATLEELDEADLLLHVVDLSAPDASEQCQTVEDILAGLGLAGKKRITVLNKIDRCFDDEPGENSTLEAPAEATVMVSAIKGWGLPRLLETIEKALGKAPASL